MFAVVRNFEAGDANRAEAMHESSQGTVAFAGKLYRLGVSRKSVAASDVAIVTFRFETLQSPWGAAFDVFAPEHRFEFRAADFAAKAIYFIVGNWPELALHFLWNLDAKLAFQQISDAAFAG